MLFGNSPSDFGFLPPQFNGDVQVFFPTGITQTQTQNWQHWTKPRGISMVYMLAIAGGGGGGGGFSGASNTARGGGGSGACSGLATLMMPAIFLPDSLKIMVGAGGQGGAAGVAGSAGSNSYISVGAGNTTGIATPQVILSSGVNAPGGGGAGTGAAGGTAGTVPSAATIATLGPLGKLGFFPGVITLLGNAGTIGLAGNTGGSQLGGAGTAITAVWNSIPFSQGTSGAGINTPAQTGLSGGSITLQGTTVEHAEGMFTTLAGGSSGTPVVGGGNGNNGIRSFKPFLHTGGTGGGSSDSYTGGNGGMGGIGCGGGGGGAGTTGGRGGDGGPGMVAIICW
jgi:hypothetical protein